MEVSDEGCGMHDAARVSGAWPLLVPSAGGVQHLQEVAEIDGLGQVLGEPSLSGPLAIGFLSVACQRDQRRSSVAQALAQSTGRSYGFVHRILSETGASLRGRGGATRGQRQS